MATSFPTQDGTPPADASGHSVGERSPVDRPARPPRDVADPAWVANQRRGRRRAQRRNAGAAAMMLAPNLIAYIIFLVVPALAGVGLSFFEWDLFSTPEWVGLDNYRRLADDPVLVQVLLHTLAFLVLGVIPTILIGFCLAVLSNWKARGIGSIRVLYFLPLVVSTAVAGVLWSYMFDARNGVVNLLLGSVGLPTPAWLGTATWALPAVTVVVVWLSLPLVIILYLAGLQRVPPQIYEAAALDGAGAWRRMWQISWPSVAPTTALIVGLELLQFLAMPFEVALIMTGGGPLNSTTTLSLHAFQEAFDQREIGYASALSMLQFFLVLLLVGLIGLVVQRRRRSR